MSDYQKGVLVIKAGIEEAAEEAALAFSIVMAKGIKVLPLRAKPQGEDKTVFPFVCTQGGSLGARCGAGQALADLGFENVKVEDLVREGQDRAKRLRLLEHALHCMQSQRTSVSAAELLPADAGKGGDILEGLVGLDREKEKVLSIAKAVSAYGRSALGGCSMVFAGDPGTGKTTLARHLLALFDDAGITSGKGTFVEASVEDLVSEYIGKTDLVEQAFQRAKGGILFIDEAHRLGYVGTDTGGTDHGSEVTAALNASLENHRDDVVCILAGYGAELEEFLFSYDPGLRDRVCFTVKFHSYTEGELVEVFSSMAEARGFAVGPDCAAAVTSAVRRLRGRKDFANARTMRKLLDVSIVELAQTGGRTIGAAHLEAALAGDEFRQKEKRKVGFA